ncbi:MAG TPA: aldehyde dehydrogenase family protein, partial [Myxococcaceae bacterium]|nr:aldehyde dehydrogenase family protein [Myxococcaceae bacterium]
MADGRLWIDGAWVAGEHQAEVRAPWDGRLIRRVAQASAAQAEQALAVASGARERLQQQSTGKRREVLEDIVAGLRARAEEMAQTICHEAGKPITLARAEVRRAIEVFRLAAAELTRFGGSTVPVDMDAGTEGVEA